MKRAWIIVAIVGGLFLLADWILHRDAGLNRTATVRGGQNVLDAGRVRSIDLQNLTDVPGYPATTTLHWEGAWNVPSTGLYDLVVESHGRSAWHIDGQLAHEVTSAEQNGVGRTVWLAAGFHQIQITYDPDPASPHLVVASAKVDPTLQPSSGKREPLDPRALKSRLPRNPRLRAAGAMLRTAFGALLIVAVVLAIRRTTPALTALWRRRFDVAPARLSEIGKAMAWTTLAAILLHGALLRIDAITAMYGPVTSPAWLAALQTRSVIPPEAIRPGSVAWQPAPTYEHVDGPPTRYNSDPYLYVKAGREMRTFYGAHYREPVFPFATKVFLGFLGGQDVAVSFAAITFGILAIWSTYILGAAVWSRPAGLAAALGLALDVDDISLSSAGWRDDAFIATVAIIAYLMLRCWRAGNAPARDIRVGRLHLDAAYVEAVVLGVASGLAILVRIMAVSFIVPGAVWLLFAMRSSWRRRFKMTGIGAATAILVAAPYFVNCWRVYGDPWYTFNIHGNVYRIAEGQGESKQGTAAYVIGKFRSAPIEMTDTIARGMTTFPFNNKWQGLEPWYPGIRDWARIAAVVGLILLLASASGRLMVFVMMMSLVPFAFTWTVDPTWRFTAHVYPALLIAAAAAVGGVFRGLRRLLVPQPSRAVTSSFPIVPDRSRRLTLGTRRSIWLAWGAAATVLLVSIWVISSALPRRLFVENLGVHGVAEVTTGTRDAAFLGGGWLGVASGGNVRLRVATDEGVMSIPLPGAGDYNMTLRMDPFPRPWGDSLDSLPVLDVSLNGTLISSITLRWTPERVGTYTVRLPQTLTRRGNNELSLRMQQQEARADRISAGLSAGAAFGLWYVRIHPIR